MRFVDLNTGSIYNGDMPYIHWFEDNQSTNLIYSKKICVISDKETIPISLNSDIFSLLNLQDISFEEENINDFTYKNLGDFKVDFYTSTGFLYDKNSQHVYLHIIYIIGSSKQEGEFLEDLFIDQQKITIGASFYELYEPHKINLANLGVELPESITRAIYETNIHDDYYNNIVLNRKHKELLNEYWNIIANKGSYQSLYNALSWFEYGDLIKIQELWKGLDHFSQQDIITYIDNRVKNHLLNQSKTTYIGLYFAMQKLFKDDNGKVIYDTLLNDYNNYLDNNGSEYAILDRPIDNIYQNDIDQIFEINSNDVSIEDLTNNDGIDHSDWFAVDKTNYSGFIGEENPILIKASKKWSQDDLSLKMYLVGNFFETYFTPIHVDVLHSTIENIVFTNTIKIIRETHFSRTDYYNNIHTFKCNINDGDTFFLDNVSSQVGKNTIAGIQWQTYQIKDYENYPVLGVDKKIYQLTQDNNDDDALKTFMSQYFNGIGVILNFICELELEQGDCVKNINICLNHNNKIINNSVKCLNDKNIIEFNILCKNEGHYTINIDFSTIMGYNYIKTINFNILDHTTKNIKLYKVKYNTNSLYTNKEKYLPVTDYLFSHYNTDNRGKNIISQFLPEYLNKNQYADFNGVCLNRTIIYKGNIPINEIINDSNIINETKIIYKYEYNKNTKKFTDNILYTILIFPKNTPQDIVINIDKKLLIKDNYIFYPEFHHLEELYDENDIPNLDNFTITQKDVLMVVPNVEYLKTLESDIEWEFENVSLKNKIIKLPSIKTPFIANTEHKLLDPGYYNIKFRYKLGTSIQEISLNSAFRII